MPLEPTPGQWAQIRYEYEHTDKPIHDICAEHGISSGTLRDRMRRWGWRRRRPPIPATGPAAAPAPHMIFSRDAAVNARDRLDPSRGHDEAQCAAPLRAAAPPLVPAFRPAPAGEEAMGSGGSAAPQAASWRDPLFASGREGAEGEYGSTSDAGDSGAIGPRLKNAVAHVLPAIEATLAKLATQTMSPQEMERSARALGNLTRTLRELNTLLSAHQSLAPAACDDFDDIPEDMDAFRHQLAHRIEAFVASWNEDPSAVAGPEETDQAANPGVQTTGSP